MMFVEWGSRVKEKVIERGVFDCPRCVAQQPYERVKVGKYFELYWIPIHETKKLDEYIRCKGCGTNFKVEVLGYKLPSSPKERGFLYVTERLEEEGETADTVLKALTDAGWQEDVARSIVAAALGEHPKICPQCHEVYSPVIKFCSTCQGPLRTLPLRDKDLLAVEESSMELQGTVEKSKPDESIPDLIRKLTELKDAGILSEEEFEAKKKDLLSKM